MEILEHAMQNEYFDWLYNLACRNRYPQMGRISFYKLLSHLHLREFTYTIFNDKNRAQDGIDLRYRFYLGSNYKLEDIQTYLDQPCSVLEMIAALALRCEEHIMDDPRKGNRTQQWFWSMIVSLGLGSMLDERYDREYVDYVIDRFLNHEYEPNGKGGLFTVPNSDEDFRTMEIWYQMNRYLNTIV